MTTRMDAPDDLDRDGDVYSDDYPADDFAPKGEKPDASSSEDKE